MEFKFGIGQRVRVAETASPGYLTVGQTGLIVKRMEFRGAAEYKVVMDDDVLGDIATWILPETSLEAVEDKSTYIIEMSAEGNDRVSVSLELSSEEAAVVGRIVQAFADADADELFAPSITMERER